MKTPFENALEQVLEGKLKTPLVINEGKPIDYFGYQLAVHKYNLQIMSKGMSCRGVKLKDLKLYYGLKGRTASDCLPQFDSIFLNYKESLHHS